MKLFRILLIPAAGLLSFFSGCASLPENVDRTPSRAFTDTQQTLLGQALAARSAVHPPGQSGFFPLNNGRDAFVARAVLAHLAERSIDTQYYMIHNDVVGSLFVDQLYKASGCACAWMTSTRRAGTWVPPSWTATPTSRCAFSTPLPAIPAEPFNM